MAKKVFTEGGRTYKASDLSFDFGYNVGRGRKAKKATRKQTGSDRQAYAIARKKGGPLHGTGGS